MVHCAQPGLKATSTVFLALQIIASLSVNVNAMHLEDLERRAASTNASCTAEFAWADTLSKKSPCQVAAEIQAPCNGGNYNVYGLQKNQFYTPPAGGTSGVNVCNCSWVAYNLLMACTDCQGFPEAVKGWPFWSNECGDKIGTSYYPSNLLPDNVQIPAWATTDPTQWSGSQYNTIQAKQVSQRGDPEVGAGNPPAQKKKSSVGPIVGGVIGGLVAVGLAAGVAYYLLRKHRRQTKIAALGPASDKGHLRGPSDGSVGYTSFTSSSPGPGYAANGAPTIRTHVTSLNNLSVMGPHQNGNTIYTTSPSPPPGLVRGNSTNPEDFVSPFTLQQPQTNSSQSAMDRKSPNGPVTRYDSPNAPPAMGNDTLFNDTPSRPRVNPPAYTPNDSSIPSSSNPALAQARRRQGHTQNSSDADLSYASHNQSNSTPYYAGNSNGDDSSDVYTTGPSDAMSLAAGTTLTRSASGAAQTSYTSPSSYPRDIKRRPTDDSVNIG